MSRPGYHRTASTNLIGGAAPRSLGGKLAIITGGSRGIGTAIAHNLASKGANLVLNYNSDSSKEKTEQLAENLQIEHNIKALAAQADIGAPTGPALIITLTKNHFSHPKTGFLQIDILINNAGVSIEAPLESFTPEQFFRTYSVNVLGPALLVQAALPYLPHDRSGRIINLSSVSSSLGFKDQTVYGGSKAAVDAMTRTWARELAERCTVNSVNPGPVATEMWDGVSEEFEEGLRPWLEHTPLAALRHGVDADKVIKKQEGKGGRPAYESEIAGVVGMLCSAESAWCTGSVICANGGLKFSY
ncbi:MAG: hypothetical protein MMC33_006039 [Icmadophila ericetorum]|nr:hypothetical protein [Icmadophila ericetorum]